MNFNYNRPTHSPSDPPTAPQTHPQPLPTEGGERTSVCKYRSTIGGPSFLTAKKEREDPPPTPPSEGVGGGSSCGRQTT